MIPTTYLTIEEAAARLRLGKSSIRNYIKDGRLPAKKLRGGKQVLIEERDLMGLLSDAREAREMLGEPAGPGEKMPTARELMRMTRAQRRPFLEASALAAAPIYAADLARPEHERELTADLETGDFYEETEALENA